jgi:hypothetical protein
MRLQYRKTAPRVRHGKVQRKNRWTLTPDCYTERAAPIIERHKPGIGFRHILRKNDVRRFIRLLPDWQELSNGLSAIILAAGGRYDGYYSTRVVAVCAWEREIVRDVDAAWYAEHCAVFEQIGVPCERAGEDNIRCHWTESTIRAYQLTHILLHELGHHHDRMTTRSKRRSCRGEGYAERYAIQYANLIWARFLTEFGLP